MTTEWPKQHGQRRTALTANPGAIHLYERHSFKAHTVTLRTPLIDHSG
jgi:hypothetical protein